MSTARIDELARSLGRPLEAAQRDALDRFAALVRTWNARLDLTAAREERAMTEVLFADAIVMADRALVPEGASVIDVGSGAGAPALPFALLRPDVTLTMVEPLRKRIAFLRTAIGSLDLASRVRAVEGRVEPGSASALGAHDVASARATFAPEVWLETGLALAPSCLVFTAGEPPTTASAKLAHRAGYALPWSSAPRVLARFERA
ncbi:16S rRNA (guanine(527)-N(7))-methyltransferase RsmG [Sandaracinus amylolyticus]|uniref:Ribosomal RNA small subunit methyltransferase G n=1 Tax=Sandaracinus amylolyticus TaxID=927083 RepID=A0A0F6W6A9_9BACT|nr:RsmG family class I SAM-dependent methyltransferase [Sandaracinus amylolyticus]AKF08408.1 rRNA small subunit 7-methylguanosine (m7G) methyltransferase GidB [Sandaracinus amylolyticus]